jgi:hypothetical protein
MKDYDGATSGNGTIRLRVELANELIMPLPSYEPLMAFIDECVQTDDDVDNGFLSIMNGTPLWKRCKRYPPYFLIRAANRSSPLLFRSHQR